jgi:hypothetical protein
MTKPKRRNTDNTMTKPKRRNTDNTMTKPKRVFLRFTASDYPFGIFKLFLHTLAKTYLQLLIFCVISKKSGILLN